MKPDPAWIKVASVADACAQPENLLGVSIAGLDLVLIYTNNGLHCFEDRCSHQPIKLSDFGEVYQGRLVCHAHGAQFDVCDSGKALCFPAVEGLKAFPVKTEGDSVFIKIL